MKTKTCFQNVSLYESKSLAVFAGNVNAKTCFEDVLSCESKSSGNLRWQWQKTRMGQIKIKNALFTCRGTLSHFFVGTLRHFCLGTEWHSCWGTLVQTWNLKLERCKYFKSESFKRNLKLEMQIFQRVTCNSCRMYLLGHIVALLARNLWTEKTYYYGIWQNYGIFFFVTLG